MGAHSAPKIGTPMVMAVLADSKVPGGTNRVTTQTSMDCGSQATIHHPVTGIHGSLVILDSVRQ